MAKYIDLLFRHRLRFVLLIFVVPSLLAGSCIFLFPHQTSSSSLWVDSPAYVDISPSVQGWNQYLTPSQNTVDALNQLRVTDRFVGTLRSTLDSMGAFQDDGERQSIPTNASTDITITAPGSHLVGLSYTCPREPLCSQVLTATEEIYRQWLTDQQSAQASVAIDFYTGQLKDAQTKLASDQTALSNFLATHPSVKPSDGAPASQFELLTQNVDQDLLQVADFQQKLDSINLTNAAVGKTTDTVLKVIDAPRPVGGRLSNLPKKQMLIAAAAGLALAAGMLVFMAWSDRSVRDERELENILKLPIVATIPDLGLKAADG